MRNTNSRDEFELPDRRSLEKKASEDIQEKIVAALLFCCALVSVFTQGYFILNGRMVGLVRNPVRPDAATSHSRSVLRYTRLAAAFGPATPSPTLLGIIHDGSGSR